ncbi:hypothetical protein ACTL6P_14845 [Endozoicomonas acroporae]|uniref:hypothetical protein n=1 Tax=Endozoicomonas acroporae TaxID=1701104 RepID=UPI000C7660F7|nr:hypothetical protein [Endozoicomonas acroporae]
MSKLIDGHKVSIEGVKGEFSEFYNDGACGSGGQEILKYADEYAYQRYGISAVDIICGGDMKEFFAKWYDEKIGVEAIRQLIDEQAEKYDLTIFPILSSTQT